MLTQVPELNSIFKLLELSKRGLSFSGPIKEKVGQALIGLQYESDFQSLLTLINILKEMSLVNPNILNTTDLTTSDTDKNDRLKKVFNYIKSN